MEDTIKKQARTTKKQSNYTARGDARLGRRGARPCVGGREWCV